jgi:hypothetical protein
MANNKNAALKTVQNQFKLYLKPIAKDYGFKCIDNYLLYQKTGTYFIDIITRAWFKEKYLFTVRMSIKPYVYDNIFWEAFDMSENAQAKESLRANGAFVAPTVDVFDKSYAFENEYEVEQVCKNAIEECRNMSAEFISQVELQYGDFDAYILNQSNIHNEMLLKMLAHIHRGDYLQAKNLAEDELRQGREGRFKNKGMYINEHIVKYCLAHLS